jgi:hypothetical protein
MPERLLRHDPALASAVERQLRDWSIARQQRLESAPALPGRTVHDFITISRSVGCEGDAVARLVGERLGWPVFDKEILQAMAGDDQARKELYQSLDGRDMSWVEEATTAFLHPDFVRNDYFRRLVETAFSLARGGPAVFLGRGVDLILPRERGLRVRLGASRDACVAAYAAARGLPAAEARRQVDRIEKERAEFIRHHFRVEATDLSRFDLGINLDHISVRDAAELIIAAHNLRT